MGIGPSRSIEFAEITPEKNDMKHFFDTCRPFGLWAIILMLFGQAAVLQAQETSGKESRLLTVDDYFELADVSDPQISPEGDWIAYTVSRSDID